ncbi:hypothetical protein MRX96_030925 [Rhipicephalus microplus]
MRAVEPCNQAPGLEVRGAVGSGRRVLDRAHQCETPGAMTRTLECDGEMVLGPLVQVLTRDPEPPCDASLAAGENEDKPAFHCDGCGLALDSVHSLLLHRNADCSRGEPARS